MVDRVTIYEVGPRDGLQNERELVATHDKIALVDLLSAAGLSKIEATSFVSPKWVPQLADADAVMRGIARKPGVAYCVLTPNLEGYERASAAKADEIAIFASASETFSRKNINCSIAESFERFLPVVRAAHAAHIPVRGYVSCVVACPYEGPVAPLAVQRVAERLLALGCYEVSLGDTIGAGTPEMIAAMVRQVTVAVPAERIAGHFHDSNGQALANIEASLDLGIRTFDSAVGGLGGCPYAPGAKGNVSTRAVVDLLNRLQLHTGIDDEKLAVAEAFISSRIARLSTPRKPQHA